MIFSFFFNQGVDVQMCEYVRYQISIITLCISVLLSEIDRYLFWWIREWFLFVENGNEYVKWKKKEIGLFWWETYDRYRYHLPIWTYFLFELSYVFYQKTIPAICIPKEISWVCNSDAGKYDINHGYHGKFVSCLHRV